MNSTQANSIHTIEIITRLNIPYRKSGIGFLCSAPYREDNNPSFYLVENRWKDLATGERGKTLDMVRKIFKCSVSEALGHIESLMSHQAKNNFLFQKQNQTQSTTISNTTIKKIQPLQNVTLSNYLISRNIDIEIAKEYCSEIYLSIKGKNYFYIAFLNDSDGFELRNKYMKSCHGSKDVSIITGTPTISVFEGFIDFLSAMILWPEKKENTFIILNSVANTSRAIEKIKTLPTSRIELYLDNDTAGDAATNKILSNFPGAVDARMRIHPHKDVNDLLMNCKQ